MAQERRLPLLALPWPDRAEKTTKERFPGSLHLPSYSRQRARLEPRFERLQRAFELRSAELREELGGVEPELALVLEVAGTLKSFRGAIKDSGFQWLLESDLFDVEPDEDFFRESGKQKKPFSGSLYLVMSDQQARSELLSLWKKWDKNRELQGESKAWRDFFNCLKDIRVWGPEDRLRETGLLEDWKERLAQGQESLRAEVELWFVHHALRWRRAEDRVQEIVKDAGGQILDQAWKPEISYHALLVEVPASEATRLLESQDVSLVNCEDVMFLRPVGQCVALPPDGELGPSLEAVDDQPLPEEGEPIVALLDGFPLEQHQKLKGRLEVDDPEDWAGTIPPAHRTHGTAMASLILHGELGAGSQPLQRRIHVRPVLKPAPSLMGPPPEQIPEDVLMVDFLNRAIRRLLKGEGDAGPTAPNVLVVNFSIGDPSRPFDGFVSPMARLLDWLSWEYRVLFIVSAGNHPGRLVLGCARQDFSNLSPEEIEKQALEAVQREAHLRRLLAPAEGMNVLTIGAEHADAAGSYQKGSRIDPFGERAGTFRIPSPLNSIGPGIQRGIKPEILIPGGRQLYRERLGTAHEKAEMERSAVSASPPGQRVAAPATGPGELTATRYLCGTSNATALATRTAAILCEQFPALFSDETINSLPRREALIPLLKAFLVHGSSWGSSQEWIRTRLGLGGRSARPELGRFLGYGFLDETRILGCAENRVTLVDWRHLGNGEGFVYQIPLPPSLAGQVVTRRLIVTLAHLTPLNHGDRRYRQAQLWFAPEKDESAFDIENMLGARRCEADAKAVGRGTVQHEIFEGDKALTYEQGDMLKIKVNCREDAKGLDRRIHFGFLVTLEVAPGVDVSLPVYDEVRDRVAQIRARQSQKIRT